MLWERLSTVKFYLFYCIPLFVIEFHVIVWRRNENRFDELCRCTDTSDPRHLVRRQFKDMGRVNPSQTIGLYCSYYRDTTPNRPCVKFQSKM